MRRHCVTFREPIIDVTGLVELASTASDTLTEPSGQDGIRTNEHLAVDVEAILTEDFLKQ
jgi:hypothetical protein